jgi:hypothetical protein
MRVNGRGGRTPHPWRSFSARDGAAVEREVKSEIPPSCPGCGDLLEAQPESRIQQYLVLDATAYDLACRTCHRFWPIVRHTQRSLQLMRMRKFVAALKAVDAPRRTAEPRTVQAIVSTPTS